MTTLLLREPDDDLIPLLRSSSREDLQPLVEFIMKSNTAELRFHPDFISQNPQANQTEPVYNGDHSEYPDLVAAEIQKFGGNSIVNMLRGGQGVSYMELVLDVADKMGVIEDLTKTDDVASVESAIQLKVLDQAYENMSEDERRTLLISIGEDYKNGIPAALPIVAVQAVIKYGGFNAYRLSLIVANAVARSVLGHGLSLAVNASIARTLGIFTGPIGLAVSILWAVVDIAGPAYRTTIPSVLHIAYLRQKSKAVVCNKCGSAYSVSSESCPVCSLN